MGGNFESSNLFFVVIVGGSEKVERERTYGVA
jgi:hypothetical protein